MNVSQNLSDALNADAVLRTGDRSRLLAWTELTLSRLAEVAGTIDSVLDALRSFGYLNRDVFAVELTLHEALTNALHHGNALDPSLTVRLRYALTHDEICLEVEDEGPGFQPAEVDDPTDDAQFARCGGRGVFLMRHYMTQVRYNDRGNCVTLRKRRGLKAAS